MEEKETDSYTSTITSVSENSFVDDINEAVDSTKDPTCCSICCSTIRTQYVADCEELKSILEIISNSEKRIIVTYACQTCLYKFYSVIEKNKLGELKAERQHRLNTVNALIEKAENITSAATTEENETSPNIEREQEKLEAPAVITEVASNASTSSHSHLDIMFEQSESALITESGGGIEQSKANILKCPYCPKVFALAKLYKRHTRSHVSKTSIRSSSSVRGVTSPPVYSCTNCSATFDNAAKLKSHSRIHLKRYYCSYCHKENLSLYDHNFHEAECKGLQMAKETENRPNTRLLARSRRSVVSEKAQSAVRSRSAQTKKSAKTLRSRKSSKKTNRLDNNDDSDDDCATSVCTDYISPSYVENWVAGTLRSNSEYHNKSLASQEINANAVIVSKKEYDLVMLHRLIAQAEHNVYSCFFPGCDNVTNNLRDMCLHELVVHKYKTHFYCRKCKGVFTSKLFYDYHMHLQNYGEYRCHKCTMRFSYEYDLHYHLLQHQQNDAFPCRFCSNSFMSEKDLKIHCIETGHDAKKRKATISIDHNMTIENETTPDPPPCKRSYKCTINIMKLTNPLKRSNSFWDKGKRLFLGDIDYQYEPGMNCVRTK